ncbi:MAG: hypothetical protein ABIQ39_06035 [Ilumatobacteraceae bacterium]
MGFLEDAKEALDGGNLKDQAEGIAKKLDDQAEKLSGKDGVVGDVAGKAHELLDKVDGD